MSNRTNLHLRRNTWFNSKVRPGGLEATAQRDEKPILLLIVLVCRSPPSTGAGG